MSEMSHDVCATGLDAVQRWEQKKEVSYDDW